MTYDRPARATVSLGVRCAAAVGLLALVTMLPAATGAGAGADDNLGDALLDEGLGDLFPGLKPENDATARSSRPPARPSAQPLAPPDDVLRRMMEESAGVPSGEDVGGRNNPLVGIAERMTDAGRMVGDGRVETAALPIQRQVVADLDRLIAEMEKQCSSSSSSQQKQQQQKQQSQRSQSKPSGGKPAGSKPQSSASQQAAMQSSGVPQGGEAEPPASAGPLGADALKAAWGHLPQRVREQMLQSSADEFLPEYREEIEAYYRKLAEDDAE